MIKWQHFGYNNLTGTTIFSITEIRHLYGLIYVLNIILAGVIPREIGNWYFLQQLNLQFNSLTGSIPIEISRVELHHFIDKMPIFGSIGLGWQSIEWDHSGLTQ